jgi:hypothetical protein
MKSLEPILLREPVYLHEWECKIDVIADFEGIEINNDSYERCLLSFIDNEPLKAENKKMANALMKWRHIKILFASYSVGGYEGNAFVLFERYGKLFEVNAYHCSCYGLEFQFEPQETTIEALAYRLTNGTLGREGRYDVFADKLKWFLGVTE